MKKFSVICTFHGNIKSSFDFYIGQPLPSVHPIHFQTDWLAKTRGGSVPSDILEALTKVQKIAQENNTDFEELCYYAMVNANKQATDTKTANNATKPSEDYVDDTAATNNDADVQS